jgi:hypothetical protein
VGTEPQDSRSVEIETREYAEAEWEEGGVEDCKVEERVKCDVWMAVLGVFLCIALESFFWSLLGTILHQVFMFALRVQIEFTSTIPHKVDRVLTLFDQISLPRPTGVQPIHAHLFPRALGT